MELFYRSIICATFLFVSSCTQTGPGVGDIDKYMVHTPVFADNRVFFVGPRGKDQVIAKPRAAQ